VADSANVKVVILWAEEIRVAARALHDLVGLLKEGKKADPKEFDRALKAALESAHAALFNHEILEGAPLVVCEAPLRTVREPRIIVDMQEQPEAGEQEPR
jgi:hypothetical protein